MSKNNVYRVANNPKFINQQKEQKEEQAKITRDQLFTAVQKMRYSHKNILKGSSSLSKFNVETVARYMQNPIAHEKHLRSLSNYIYNVNSQYKLIINYLALLPMYAYKLVPKSNPFEKKDPIKKRDHFIKVLQYVEKLNLQHEMISVMRTVFREDAYFGYEYETKDSFALQKMDADYCRISSREEGVYNYEFDFTFFDSRNELLAIYPDEFTLKYSQYKATKENWIELDSNRTIVVKFNEDNYQFSLPPLSGMFEAIFDYDTTKKISMAKSKMDVFMALVQKIPIDDKSGEVNKLLIDGELANQFHHMASESLPSGVTFITSPMEIEAIKMEKNRTDQDILAQSMRAIYDAGGVSQFIHNSDKNTGVGLDKSILADEELVMSVLRQIERWVNRKINRMSGNNKYKFEFLDMTVFNKEKFYEKYLKAAQFGIPVKLEIGAALGLSPLDFVNKAVLENDLLGLGELLIPLQSSHVQNGDPTNTGGKPIKPDDEISASTEVNRNNA